MEPHPFGLNGDLTRLNEIVWGASTPAYADYSAHERDTDFYSKEVGLEQLKRLVAENFVSDSFQERRGLSNLQHFASALEKSKDYHVEIVVLVDKAHQRTLWARIQPVGGVDELPTA